MATDLAPNDIVILEKHSMLLDHVFELLLFYSRWPCLFGRTLVLHCFWLRNHNIYARLSSGTLFHKSLMILSQKPKSKCAILAKSEAFWRQSPPMATTVE